MARTMRRPLDPQQQRRLRRRIVLMAAGAVLLLIVAGILSFYLRVTGGPTLPSEVRARIAQEQRQDKTPATSDEVQQRAGIPAGTPPFRQQVQQLQTAARSGNTGPRTLYITDSELNDEMSAAVARHGQLQDARAYFGDGRAYFIARVNRKGREWNLTLELLPQVTSGAVRFVVDKVFIGRVEAPAAIADVIKQELAKRGDWFKPERTGLYVETVELRPGAAVLTGRPAGGR